MLAGDLTVCMQNVPANTVKPVLRSIFCAQRVALCTCAARRTPCRGVRDHGVVPRVEPTKVRTYRHPSVGESRPSICQVCCIYSAYVGGPAPAGTFQPSEDIGLGGRSGEQPGAAEGRHSLRRSIWERLYEGPHRLLHRDSKSSAQPRLGKRRGRPSHQTCLRGRLVPTTDPSLPTANRARNGCI